MLKDHLSEATEKTCASILIPSITSLCISALLSPVAFSCSSSSRLGSSGPDPWPTSSQLQPSIKLSLLYSFFPRLSEPIVLSLRTHSTLGKNAISSIKLFLTFIDHLLSPPSVNTLPLCSCLLTSALFVQTFVYVCVTPMTAGFHPSGLAPLNR